MGSRDPWGCPRKPKAKNLAALRELQGHFTAPRFVQEDNLLH
ncbi:MAG: hypothetical protein ACYDBH_25330 [Acidobacteriaceae bacterium]